MVVEDKYAYYASQAVYGSGVHHQWLFDQGWEEDYELTTHNARTYVKDGHALIAYKGTDPTNLTDLDADTAIAVGTHGNHKEFLKAKDLAKLAKERFGNNVTTTGHSLGGTKAIEAANAIGGKAIVFNPGTGLFKLDTGDHKVYVKRQDPISVRIKGSNIDWSDGGHSLTGFEDMFNPRPKVSSGVRPQASGVRRGVGKKRGYRF